MVTFCLAKLIFSQIVTFCTFPNDHFLPLNFPQIINFWEHEIVKHKRESTLVQIVLPN